MPDYVVKIHTYRILDGTALERLEDLVFDFVNLSDDDGTTTVTAEWN